MSTDVQFQYTAREFDSIKSAIVQHLQTNFYSTWNDYTLSNAGMAMVDVIAYATAILSWNLDKQINETFLGSAQFKNSVLRIAEMFGYKPVGRRAATCLTNAYVSEKVVGTLPVIIGKGKKVKSLSGLIFEVNEETRILPGSKTPRTVVSTEINTIPSNQLVDFVSGSNVIQFSNDAIATFPVNTLAGMYIRSTNESSDTSWYKIVSVNSERTELSLSEAWNSIHQGPFVIKMYNNDAETNTTLISSTPYGSFLCTATAIVGTQSISLSSALPDRSDELSYIGKYWRFNNAICNVNKYYKIGGISDDRKILYIDTAFGPMEGTTFNSLNSGFIIENRGLMIIHGESREESFPSTGEEFQTIKLSASNIIQNSIRVFDRSGVYNLDGSKKSWTPIESLSLATDSYYRSYELLMEENDKYSILFGDNISGRKPTGLITVQYRVGGGTTGNLPKKSFSTTIQGTQGTSAVTIYVNNDDTAASGGYDGETVDEMKKSIPSFHATNNRAVTADDIIHLILVEYHKWEKSIGIVSKANVTLPKHQFNYGGNYIYVNCWKQDTWEPLIRYGKLKELKDLYQANTYTRLIPVDGLLQDSIQEFIDNYKIVTTNIVICRGEIDECILSLDVQIEDALNSEAYTYTMNSIEQSIVDLFNQEGVYNGDPVLMSDLYGVVESIPGVIQVRLRQMYLDLEDGFITEQNSDEYLNDTPLSLRGCYDLYPRSYKNIVTIGDLRIQEWSKNIGVIIYITAPLVGGNDYNVSKDSLKKAFESYFYNLTPNTSITVDQLRSVALSTLSGSCNQLPDCATVSTTYLDIGNSSQSDIDLVINSHTLRNGENVLINGQHLYSTETGVTLNLYGYQNGLYKYSKKAVDDKWKLILLDVNHYLTLTPGSFTNIANPVTDPVTGVVVVSNTYYLSNFDLNPVNFHSQTKLFTGCTSRLDAEQYLKVISDPSKLVIKLNHPVGDTPTTLEAFPLTMYYLKSLIINE